MPRYNVGENLKGHFVKCKKKLTPFLLTQKLRKRSSCVHEGQQKFTASQVTEKNFILPRVMNNISRLSRKQRLTKRMPPEFRKWKGFSICQISTIIPSDSISILILPYCHILVVMDSILIGNKWQVFSMSQRDHQMPSDNLYV